MPATPNPAPHLVAREGWDRGACPSADALRRDGPPLVRLIAPGLICSALHSFNRSLASLAVY